MKRFLLVFAIGVLSLGHASAGIIPLPTDVDNAIAGTVNFEGSVTQGVTDLITNVAPSIMPFGWAELGIFGVFALLQVLQSSALRSVSTHHYHPLAMVVGYVAVLFRIVIAVFMESTYMVPLPGLPFNFHQMFPYLANALAGAITTDLLKQVLGYMNDAVHFLPPVGIFQVLPAAITVIVLVLIALGQVAMTIITAGSYAIVGLLTLCGPLMIPFFVLPGRDKKFWDWFDNMLVYSMYVFVGSGFIYIFCHSYIDFFTNLHGWSVANWVVHIPYMILITVVFLWSMFKVPDITHLVFGGVGGIASGFANAIQSVAVRAIAKFL